MLLTICGRDSIFQAPCFYFQVLNFSFLATGVYSFLRRICVTRGAWLLGSLSPKLWICRIFWSFTHIEIPYLLLTLEAFPGLMMPNIAPHPFFFVPILNSRFPA